MWRQGKTHLILQKKWDGIIQTEAFGISLDEIPFIDVAAGTHTVGFLDGKLSYPRLGRQLEVLINVPAGVAVTVFLHGLPPTPKFRSGHPSSPLSLAAFAADPVGFVEVKVASTVKGPVTLEATRRLSSGGVQRPLELALGTGGGHPRLALPARTLNTLSLPTPRGSGAHSNGGWGASPHYELAWRTAAQPAAGRPLALDLTRGGDSALLVLSGDKDTPSLTSFGATISQPAAGTAAVRVIHAAHAAASQQITLQIVPSASHGAAPTNVGSAVRYLDHGASFTPVPAGSYRLSVRSSGNSSTESGAIAAPVPLYEGLVCTVVVGDGARPGSLDPMLTLDRSYNSPMTLHARMVYLKAPPTPPTQIPKLPRIDFPESIKWSAHAAQSAAVTHQHPQESVVREGEASDYVAVQVPVAFKSDPNGGRFLGKLLLRVTWEKPNAAFGYPDNQRGDEMECFTKLLDLDIAKDNRTRWTFVVFGKERGMTCQVKVDTNTKDTLVPPAPEQAGLRVIKGGLHAPMPMSIGSPEGSTLTVGNGQARAYGFYSAVPTSVTKVKVEGAQHWEAESSLAAGGLYTLLVQDTDSEGGVSKLVVATDEEYGALTRFQLRFMNGLSRTNGHGTTSLTLRHGKEELPLGQGLPEAPLVAGLAARSALVPGALFATPQLWMQAWAGSGPPSPRLMALGTLPPDKHESIQPHSCPPRCPLAEGLLSSADPTKPVTVMLVNDTAAGKLKLVSSEDDVTPPKLCTARVRVVSLLAKALAVSGTRAGTAQPASFASPGLGQPSEAQEVPHGSWTFGFESSAAKCVHTLEPGRCYTLYVFPDGAGAPHSCRLDVDKDYAGGVGHVRLAHAGGNNNSYTLTATYKESSCRPAIPDFPSVGFGDHSSYVPLPSYSSSQYSLALHEVSGDGAPHGQPVTVDVTLQAGKNWTLYVVPGQTDWAEGVSVWALEDAELSNEDWKPSDGVEQIGLRWLDALAADRQGTSVGERWRWTQCDGFQQEDSCEDSCESSDGCEMAGFDSDTATEGASAALYAPATLNRQILSLPTTMWSIGLRANRAEEQVQMEYTETEQREGQPNRKAGDRHTDLLQPVSAPTAQQQKPAR